MRTAKRVTVLEPVSGTALEKFDAACGGRAPDALRRFLQLTGGFRHGALSFEPEADTTSAFGFETLLPASDNGSGDGLFIEVDAGRSRVWWIGHDSWFIVYWGDLETFLAQLIDKVHELAESGPDEVWSPSRAQPSQAKKGDPELDAFTRDLPERTTSAPYFCVCQTDAR